MSAYAVTAQKKKHFHWQEDEKKGTGLRRNNLPRDNWRVRRAPPPKTWTACRTAMPAKTRGWDIDESRYAVLNFNSLTLWTKAIADIPRWRAEAAATYAQVWRASKRTEDKSLGCVKTQISFLRRWIECSSQERRPEAIGGAWRGRGRRSSVRRRGSRGRPPPRRGRTRSKDRASNEGAYLLQRPAFGKIEKFFFRNIWQFFPTMSGKWNQEKEIKINFDSKSIKEEQKMRWA